MIQIVQIGNRLLSNLIIHK